MNLPDLRAEAELTWRFRHADDEAAGAIKSVWRENIYVGSIRHKPARVRTASGGGVTEDVGLRCGPVYVNVPAPPVPELEADLDERALAAMRKAARIDHALHQLAPLRRERLRLAFGLPQAAVRIGLWPVPLVSLAPLASALHRGSGSSRTLESWLCRVADKPGTSLAFDLEEAAGALVAGDSRAYCSARFW